VNDRVIDFDEEGLLDGVSGADREARKDLLERLVKQGVPVDDLRRAIEEDRLALLPAEWVLGVHAAKLTKSDVAERSGLDVEFLIAHWRALGLPEVADDQLAFTDEDVEAARDLKRFLDAGLDPDGLLQVARVVGEGLSRTADAVGDLVAGSLLRPGDTERDLGLRFAEVARTLTEPVGRELDYVFKLHLREHVRNEAVGRATLESGQLVGTETVVVCFADLVGFTKLGEELPPDELGHVAGRLSEMAGDVVRSPVRLVKTIGDAAMLVSTDTRPLLEAALELVDLADGEGEDFPQLRSGVSRGDAVERSGDWYGPPVNVASRVTAIARPGSVLATGAVHDSAEEDFAWSRAGRRRLKGVRDPVPLYRARRTESREASN
jgi:adenylate cyclase